MGTQKKLDFDFQYGIRLFSDGFATVGREGGDFWRAFLDTDEVRELSVYSHAQTPVTVTEDARGAVIVYDRLTAEDGVTYDISLTVNIARGEDGSLRFSAVIENRCDATVNELQLPFVDAYDWGCAAEKEELFIAEGLGAHTVNPRQRVSWCHTEYMSADYKSTWMAHTYPPAMGSRGMSMPWMGLQLGSQFLYFGEHNPEMRITGFNIGIPPRHHPSALMCQLSHYPAVRRGECVETAQSVIALFDGDWRDGAAYYRDWSERTWRLPQRIPDWVRDITGWQRVILKHQYGEIFWKYGDLPRLYEEGKKYGLNALLVFGWWKGRFDNNYPEYEADPALGGEEALRAAIAEIQRRGGHVLLYSNGNLIDVKTQFYRDIGQKISHKDIDGNEYREHYQFSNDGTVLRNYGYKSFDTACHRTAEWHDNLLRVARLKLSFDPDSIFFDQLGCCLKLCFDASHPHGNRIDEDGMGRYENIRAIREITPAGKAIGTEWMCDRYANLVDYVHGCGTAFNYTPDAFPDIYLHTFPGIPASNRFIHDDKPGFADHLNYAFVCGMIFDVCIWRGRRCGIAGVPAYAEHVKYLNDLKQTYHKYFFRGTFSSMYGEALPAGIRASRLTAPDGDVIAALWNTTSAAVTFTLWGKTVTVRAKDVAVAEYPA